MKELILSLVAGILCGVTFRIIKLPLPAPAVLSGVMGIVGIFIGGKIVEIFTK